MTCIAAIQCEDGVWIGWDSFLGDQYECVQDRSKVVSTHNVHFGCAGSARFQQILEHYLKIRAPKHGIEEWAVTKLVPDIKRICEEQGLWKDFAESEANAPSPECLIVASGRLLAMQEDWYVAEPAEGYAAVGAGSMGALCVLAATSGKPDRRIRKAIRATARHCTQVKEPVHVVFFPR